MDLRQQLHESLRGRVCLVGLGGADRGDDAAGMRLAEMIERRLACQPMENGTAPTLVQAGLDPESHLGRLAGGEFDQVVFLDATAFGGEPGSAVLLDSTRMQSRWPQVSTHRLSLGLLARMIESSGRARVWLLGVEPAAFGPGSELSAVVQTTLEALAGLVEEVYAEAGASRDSKRAEGLDGKECAGGLGRGATAPAGQRPRGTRGMNRVTTEVPC